MDGSDSATNSGPPLSPPHESPTGGASSASRGHEPHHAVCYACSRSFQASTQLVAPARQARACTNSRAAQIIALVVKLNVSISVGDSFNTPIRLWHCWMLSSVCSSCNVHRNASHSWFHSAHRRRSAREHWLAIQSERAHGTCNTHTRAGGAAVRLACWSFSGKVAPGGVTVGSVRLPQPITVTWVPTEMGRAGFPAPGIGQACGQSHTGNAGAAQPSSAAGSMGQGSPGHATTQRSEGMPDVRCPRA